MASASRRPGPAGRERDQVPASGLSPYSADVSAAAIRRFDALAGCFWRATRLGKALPGPSGAIRLPGIPPGKSALSLTVRGASVSGPSTAGAASRVESSAGFAAHFLSFDNLIKEFLFFESDSNLPGLGSPWQITKSSSSHR
jgi:hypothetical protein